MDQTIQTTLTDDQIVGIATKIDNLILEVGDEFKPSGIEFAAIALGRLMVFTNQVGCHSTFMKMLGAVSKMAEVEQELGKTEDLKQESA